jgi:hypothetical protein
MNAQIMNSRRDNQKKTRNFNCMHPSPKRKKLRHLRQNYYCHGCMGSSGILQLHGRGFKHHITLNSTQHG